MKLIDLFATMNKKVLIACKSTEGQKFIFKANRETILSRGKEVNEAERIIQHHGQKNISCM